MSGISIVKKTVVDGEEFLTFLETGKVVNISELVRILKAVNEKVPPGASEEQLDAVITDTIKRMSPN